jgi:hypothetical protein
VQRGNTRQRDGKQAATAIVAHLHGSDSCYCPAFGITINTSSPVLALLHRLVARGVDPQTPLDAFRGDVLCLRVRSIGEAAGLEINARGTGFIARRERRAAPPIRKSAPAGTRHREAAA